MARCGILWLRREVAAAHARIPLALMFRKRMERNH
jgi:hypothetical protein